MTRNQAIAFAMASVAFLSLLLSAAAAAPPIVATLKEPLHDAYVSRSPEGMWDLASTNAGGLAVGNRVQTKTSGEANIQLGVNSSVLVGELSMVEILAPRTNSAGCRLDLSQGLLYMLHRDQPGKIEVESGAVNAAIEGTDFAMTADSNGVVTVTMIDGKVRLSNPQGFVDLTNLQMGVARPGQAPTNTSVLYAVNAVQWSLYYPGVLDPAELGLPTNGALGPSLAAYKSGDLVGALAQFPSNYTASSDIERSYQAELSLSAGGVERAQALLASEQSNPISKALQLVIAAVKQIPLTNASAGGGPSQLLGYSYYAQSRHDLDGALKTAQAAVAKSPEFGFGWERVADLQFSFGKVSAAETALQRALRLMPRNAQAYSLEGFILAAQNQIGKAIQAFNTAIALDPNLGTARLGRGLCQIHRGHETNGMNDLQTAALLEPTRSLLRSYLGKAYANAGDDRRAHQELNLARRLDPNDPTPWLYLALLDYEENRTIQAVDDLQKTVDLSTNRQVYRSGLLLDQDRAVSSANLAKIYQDAGMDQYSLDEASRAVDYDYANYSAHLFLAESYDALRDPTRFNLRYETAWFNELLLANLYAPVGARPISQNISQQEYSRLFEKDGVGLDTTTQYRSDRQLTELASQYGAFGQTSYSLDLDYQHNDGILHPYRTNNTLSDIEWYSQVKQQLGPNDAVTIFTKYENYHSGDNYQYNNVTNSISNFHYSEYETPIAVGAWHHDWQPGVQTLFLAGRLTDQQDFSTPNNIPVVVNIPTYSSFPEVISNYTLSDQFVIYTTELNQLIQTETHTLILGVRYQFGQFNTDDLAAEARNANLFLTPPFMTNVTTDFDRFSAYAYHIWTLLPGLQLTTGVNYDDMTYPANFRFGPVSSGEASRQMLEPKLALTYSLSDILTLRAAYGQAMSGASFDESFTLEPTQLGGFNQAFRSVISESVVGSVAAARYQVLGIGMNANLPSHTFLTLQAQELESDLNEDVGILYGNPSGSLPNYFPGTSSEEMHYREPSFEISINQFIGREVTCGIGYNYTRSTLEMSDPFLLGYVPGDDQLTAQLHEVASYLQLTHPSGFYACVEANWYTQFNSGYQPGTSDMPLAQSEFTQVNLYAGWRFFHRRADLTFGVLNVGGNNYSLNPLNAYNELPRSRVWMGRFRFNF